MIERTTPTLAIEIEGMDLTGCDVHVTFKKPGMSVTVVNPELVRVTDTCHVALVPLTQEQTANLTGQVQVQANIIDASGFRAATNKKWHTISANLIREELTHG